MVFVDFFSCVSGIEYSGVSEFVALGRREELKVRFIFLFRML